MEVQRPPLPARPRRLRRSAGLLVAAVLAVVAIGAANGASAGAGLPDESAAALGSVAPAASAGASPGASAGLSGGPLSGTGLRPRSSPPIVPVPQLQARLDAIRVKYRIPGVSATIIWPDGTTWTGVSGYANVATKAPVVAGTAFSIGSVTKTFLAATILELQQEGRLSLNDTIRHWLPTVKASTTVTVRELLDQTSGLYDFFANPRIDTAILANKLSRWSAARALGYMRGPYCTPGTCWHYSNSGYVILGQLVKRITGNSAAVEIRRRFLDPLALGRAFAQGIETQRGPVALSYHVVGPYATARQVALGDGTSISPWTSVVTAAGDAGDMAATSTDLATWARDLYGGSVLSAASLAAMLDVRHSVVVGSSFRYGLGMFQVTIDGHRTVGHDGRLDGSRASIRYVPDSGFTIAVATNQDRVGPDVFGASLLAIAMGPPPPPRAWLAPSPSPAVASPSPPGASPSGAVVPSSSDVPASPEDSAAPSDPPSDSASADPSGP